MCIKNIRKIIRGDTFMNMKINRTSSGTSVENRKINISNKQEFSQSFNFARQQKNEQQLKKMIDDIKKKGERLVITKNYVDVKMYKKIIKEYLESVMGYMYSVKKDVSFWQTQYFMTVDTIDGKLEELTNILVEDQKENLLVAATIDEITGLLVDIYK